MVVPCLRHHLQGHGKADQACYADGCACGGGRCFAAVGAVISGVLFREQVAQHYADGGNSHAYPDGKCVERAGEGIVAFARLSGCLVEVEHDSNACHEEEEEYDPELFDAAARVVAVLVESLIEQADESEQKRQHVVDVVAFVAFAEFVGQGRLVAEACAVDGVDACDPVAEVRLAVALEVVLASCEVP